MNSEFSTICLNVSCKYSRNCVVVFVHLVVFCREILILVVTLFFDNRGLRGDEMEESEYAGVVTQISGECILCIRLKCVTI